MKTPVSDRLSPAIPAFAARRLSPLLACCGALILLVSTYPAYTVPQAGTPAVNTVIVTQAPPALQAEVVLAQPTPQHVWLAGYWTWRDERYEWMAGHWELPPTVSSVWVAPRWEQQGNAYRFYEGYWN